MIEGMFTCGRFGIGDFPLLQLFVLRGIVSQLQLSGDAEKQNGGINQSQRLRSDCASTACPAFL